MPRNEAPLQALVAVRRSILRSPLLAIGSRDSEASANLAEHQVTLATSREGPAGNRCYPAMRHSGQTVLSIKAHCCCRPSIL